MKKIFTLIVLCAVVMSVQAATYRYKCGITELSVDTLQSTTKNQFTVTFKQKCKNTSEYTSKPNTLYTSTVKLVLNSDDRTLDGVYTTQGASTTSSTANVNDQTINMVTSDLTTSDGTNRSLYRDENYVSTFVINKNADGSYSIGECTLYFSQRTLQTDIRIYQYSFDADHILEEGIGQTPYVFGWTAGYEQKVYNYDMTVNGVSVMHENSDYDATRYFLTLSCVGKNRDTGVEHNYEVALAIYPTAESIVGTFATQGSQTILMAMDSYVKDLNINKQRNLANDSLSTIQIKSKGTNQYSFYGGTLTCIDMDANYSAVYGNKRVEAVHYYHFSDNDGAGIEFGWDENNKTVNLTATKVEAEAIVDGIRVTVTAKDENGISYTLYIELDSENIDGSFTTASGLSEWTKVSRGSNDSDITSGSTVTINAKGGNSHTISGSLLCENGYTYVLSAYDFTYGSQTTGIEGANSQELNAKSHKLIRDGQLLIIRENKTFNALGSEIK